MHWAIDKDAIVATAMAGLAEPGTSLLSPAQGDWHWEVPKDGLYRYDPRRAKQILEDAGYADRDGDGVREDAAGRELSFRLTALTEYPADQEAARMIAAWCLDVGIELRLEVVDEAEFSARLYEDADYDLFIRSRGGDIDPGFILSTYTTRQIMSWSDTRYSDPVYDRLYMLQAQAVDAADPEDTEHRGDLVDAMQKVLYRDDPSIVLWYDVNLQAFRTDRWAGYVMAPVRRRGAVLEPAALDLPVAASAARRAARRRGLQGLGVGRRRGRGRRRRRRLRRPAAAAAGHGGRVSGAAHTTTTWRETP